MRFAINRFANIYKHARILQYGMGSSIAIMVRNLA